MTYLLDTDICIYLIKKQPPHLQKRLREHSLSEIRLSTVSLFELSTGVEKSEHTTKNRKALDQFLACVILLPLDDLSAIKAAEIRADLEKKGTPIGSYDLLNAGIALAHGLTLVSNNSREFKRVDGLMLENWAR